LTPVEVFEYKQRWKPGHTVKLHTDLRRDGKYYCRVQMMAPQWNITEYTDVYEDTFHFEYLTDAKMFAAHFKEFATLEV